MFENFLFTGEIMGNADEGMEKNVAFDFHRCGLGV